MEDKVLYGILMHHARSFQIYEKGSGSLVNHDGQRLHKHQAKDALKFAKASRAEWKCDQLNARANYLIRTEGRSEESILKDGFGDQ